MEQLKCILDAARKLQSAEKRDPGILKSLIEQYNRVSQDINDSKVLPHISAFDKKIDAGWSQTNLSSNGDKKLTDMIAYAEPYINTHSSIHSPATGRWKPSHVIGIASIIISSIIAIAIYCAQHSYQRGVADGKAEVSHEYDAEKVNLQRNIESLEIKLNSINDSLKNCPSTSSK